MAVLKITYNYYAGIAQEAKKDAKEIRALIKKLYKPLKDDGPANSHLFWQIQVLKEKLNTKKEIIAIVHRMIHTSNLPHSKQQRLNELISRK